MVHSRGKKNPMWGKHHSLEARQKIGDANRGKKVSPETRQKISVSLRGRKFSLEHRQKISEALTGKKLSLETRQKLSKSHLGKKFSPEHRRKISDAMQGKKLSLETRRKISGAQQGEKHHNWKGGRRESWGYIIISKPNHPNADINGYLPEHRFVMSEVLGRPLTPEEVVHHINGIRDDNRKKNLELFPSQAKHLAFHAQVRRDNKEVL